MKRKSIVAIILMFVMLISYLPQSVMAQETGMVLQEGITIYENTRYSFRNASSGWYMNVKGAKNLNGNQVNVYPLDMSEPNTQCYTFQFVSTEEKTLMISPVCATTKYIDVRRRGVPLTTGQGICIWEADGDPIKNIIIEMQEDGSCYLTLASNRDYCIGAKSQVAAQTTQTQLVVCQKTGAAEQRWYICDEVGNPILEKEMVYNAKVYNPTMNLLDTTKTSLETIKEQYSIYNSFVYNEFHQVHLPKLIQDVETLKKNLEQLYEFIKVSPKDLENRNNYINSCKISCNEIQNDLNNLNVYKDSTSVKLFANEALSRHIIEINGWFSWITEIDDITKNIVNEAKEKYIQLRIDGLYAKLEEGNRNAGNTSGKVYFTTTAREVASSRSDECYNKKVVEQTWFKGIFTETINGQEVVVDINKFPEHLAGVIDRNITNHGWSCFGFASFAQYYLFKENNYSIVTAKEIKGQNGTQLTFSRDSLAPVLKAGDIIRIHIVKPNVVSSYHSMIFHSFTYNAQGEIDGIKVLDSNFLPANRVAIHDMKFNITRPEWEGDNVYIYRANE